MLVSVRPSISWASLSTRKAPVTLPCGLSLTFSPERSDTLATEPCSLPPGCAYMSGRASAALLPRSVNVLGQSLPVLEASDGGAKSAEFTVEILEHPPSELHSTSCLTDSVNAPFPSPCHL